MRRVLRTSVYVTRLAKWYMVLHRGKSTYFVGTRFPHNTVCDRSKKVPVIEISSILSSV